MAKRGIKFEHSVGEVALCFEPDPTKARVLYEAKILDSQVTKDKQGRKVAAYLVHFQGWNSSWDRRTNSQRRRKIDHILREACVRSPTGGDSESESDVSGSEDEVDTDTNRDEETGQNVDENGKKIKVRRRQPQKRQHSPVTIDIPDILKSHLEDDYVAVSTKSKLCSLPAKPCVLDILEGFAKTFCINYICEPVERDCKDRDKVRTEKNVLKLPAEHVVLLCKELVDGLRILFDFTLPIILLYATEQEQYELLMKNTKPEDLNEKPSATAPKTGRLAHKHGRAEGADGEDQAGGSPDSMPRRITRRATLDSLRPDDHHAASPPKRAKKQDGPQSPKLSPRTRRRRGLHVDPLEIKVEDQSDSEIEFSPPGSASNHTHTSNGHTSIPNPWTHMGPVTSAPESIGSIGLIHRKKEDLTESILCWQIVPTEVRSKPPVTPSQVYGIHHLLRLFVKLPELLNRMPFDNTKLQLLVKLCHHCLQ
ncbi:hypothetical protein BaRGS_00018863 [Batillaria attramentaria]|uniref:MRG domain-containing protein n=1 Tax=Batillaria attramentaria TaxID=370345 RepID=A0ABD0KRW4_9CAEN